MRIKALIVLGALAAAGAPAFAQQSCAEIRNNNSVGGAIVGGILGGVLGSNVAASGHRGDGTALGAVVGGMIGSGVGRNAVPCQVRPRNSYGAGSDYYPNPNYGGQGYDGYGTPNYGRDYYPGDAGYSSGRYADDRYGDYHRGDVTSRGRYRDDLDGRYSGHYNRNEDFAGSDCTPATQVTRLPNGQEIHRQIISCYDANTGEWRIRD